MSRRHLKLLLALLAALALLGCDDDGGDPAPDTSADTTDGNDTTQDDTHGDDTSGDSHDTSDTSADVCLSDSCGGDTAQDDTAQNDTAQDDTSMADTSGDTVEDTSGGDTTDASDMTDEDMTQADTIAESTDPAQEFPDCVAGCTHDGPAFTVPWDRYTAIYGIIDDQCHSLPGAAEAPDIDVIEITAAERTLLEIVVAPASGSVVDPLITTSDGLSLLTYNDEGGLGTGTARTVLAAPYINDLPFYLLIEHAPNYFAFDPSGTCAMYAGGSDHEYEITINELAFAPTELGELQSGANATGSGSLAAAGDIAYVRFTAPADATPTVTVTRTGSAAFTPTVAGMNTIQNQLVWKAARVASTDSVQLGASDFEVCNSGCDAVTGEFVFAIVDYEGLGGADYTFDVEVQL